MIPLTGRMNFAGAHEIFDACCHVTSSVAGHVMSGAGHVTPGVDHVMSGPGHVTCVVGHVTSSAAPG